MKQEQGSKSAQSVDAAFNRVLAAEAEARIAMERCREQAAAQVAAAEREARAIASRAERRIQAAHRIADQGIERALAELAIVAGDAAVAAGPDPERVESLAAALATELTGGAG